jgi:uncharacterized zinc-type alcohol dehydrogenase-like protein
MLRKPQHRDWLEPRLSGETPAPKTYRLKSFTAAFCHSDLHQARDERHSVATTAYPSVPGHEIVERVMKVGRAVKKFKEGDLAAVSCMVDSCRVCENCKEGLEQYCAQFPTFTYNGQDKVLGGVTYGGYADSIVVDEAFALRVPKELDLAGPRRFYARGSPLTHRCGIGNCKKGRSSAWLV